MTNEEVLIRTRFRLDLTPKRVVFTDDIDYTVAGDDIDDFSGVIRISGPNGLIYENTDFGDPDIVPGTSRESLILITLPVDPQNGYQVYDGTYTVKYTIRNNSTLATYEETFVYGFHFEEPTMLHDVDSGPFTATLRSRDLTNYGSHIDTLTRVHTLHYPEGITPSPPADIVTALDDYTVDPAYSNLWEITIETNVLYIQPDQLEYRWIGSIYTEHCVFGSCINDMADVLGIMFDLYIGYTTTNPAKAAQFRERLIKSSTAYSLMEIAWRAGDYEEADKQINIIQDQVQLSGVTSCVQGGPSSEVIPCGPWDGTGIASPEYTFNNAITEVAGVVSLGGSLINDTNIVAGGYHFDVSGASVGHSVQMRIDAANPHIFIAADDGSNQGKVLVYENGVDLEYNDLGTPANNKKYSLGSSGLVENADYISDYVNRSLVSKEYVDSSIPDVAVVSDASLTGDGSVGDPLQVAVPFPGFTDLSTDYGYSEPTHAFSEITSTPTTLAGYGITDAVEDFLGLSDTPSAYTGEGEKFLKVNAGETAVEFSSASGFVPDTGGTFTGQVTIFTSENYPLILQQVGSGETVGVADPSINQIQFQDNDGDVQGVIGIDGTGNLMLETNVSGQLVQVGGDFDVLGDITVSGTVDGVDINAFKTLFDAHTHDFADITSTPTTLSGYGITDAMLNTAESWLTEFDEKIGVTISDRLVIEDVADSGTKKYVSVGELPNSAATFLALTDAPSSFSGSGDYVVTVNTATTALEFTDYSGLHITTADGTLNAYSEKVLPTINDVLIIEDAADSYEQKKIYIGNLPSSGGGSGVALYYRFDNTTAKADPTAGRFRLNNATLADVTEIYVDDLAYNSIDISTIIENIYVGDYLYIQQLDSTSNVVIYRVTAIAVDEVGYYTVAVEYVSEGGDGPDNNADCGIIIQPSITSAYTFQHSIEESSGIVNLVNDEVSPGNSKLYGTDGSGAKGWFDITGDHDAVTIGSPANGLSLSTQELSLALASTSTTGALSSTDWNTFDGKAEFPLVNSGGTYPTPSASFGDGDTFLRESADDVLDLYVANSKILHFDSEGVDFVNGKGISFYSDNGSTRIANITPFSDDIYFSLDTGMLYLGGDEVIVSSSTGFRAQGTVRFADGATAGYYLKCTDSIGTAEWAAVTASQTYKGVWDADTNDPTLADGTGTAGDYYRVTVAGTQDLGSGNITFSVGDDVTYDGSVWNRIPAATIVGNALTKTDDTNVTLSLGGSASTALVNAASITVGWTGTLADERIASASNWNTAYGWGDHAGLYDDYDHWNLKTNNVHRTTIGSDGDLDIVAGTNVTVSYSAGGVVTISSTDTDTDTTYTAGDGLDLTGTEFSVDLVTDGGLKITTGQLEVDLLNIDHDNLLNFTEDEHFVQGDITTVGTIATGVWNGTALTANYVPDHDDLNNVSANEHIDWTIDQGATNIHSGNYTDTTYSDGQGINLVGTVFEVNAGSGLIQYSTGLSHDNTTSEVSSNNSGRTYIQDILIDSFGHVTGITTATETVVNTDTHYYLIGVTVNAINDVDFIVSGAADIEAVDFSHDHAWSDITSGVPTDITDMTLYDTDNLGEGAINLYYTEARVNANTNVAANTAARHDAVTIGSPANGLSLSTQELSLALASTSTTGALSSTDWNTFNDKVSFPGFDSLLNDYGYVEPTHALDELTDVVISAPSPDEILIFNGEWWINNTFAEAGIQPAATAVTTSTSFGGDVSGTYDAIVVADDSHTHDTRYYTETESDARFVEVAGDTMSGTLILPSIRITTGATDGYYLRSDINGNGTWAAVSASQTYKGTWDADTNDPTLADGTGTAGDYYRVTVAGTQDLGSGNITFNVGDDVSYDGSVWERIPAATIVGNALTKTDDTNVTLSLGGSASTALVNAASITVGWTGTLADERIASASNWNTAYGWGDHAAAGYLTTPYVHPDHTGQVLSNGDGDTILDVSAISGQTDDSVCSSTDQLLYNKGGSLRRMDISVLETYMQDNLSFDDYNGWRLYTDGTFRDTVNTNEIVNLEGGNVISLTYDSTLNTITIDHDNHTGQVLSDGTGVTTLDVSAISGQTDDSVCGSTDQLLYNKGGSLRRMDISVLETYMQDNLTFGGSISYGGTYQIPYTNTTSTAYLHSSNLTFDGSTLTLSGSLSATNIGAFNSTGTISRSTTADDQDIISITGGGSYNTNIWKIGLNNATTYGFYLQYYGAGTGNLNGLRLYTHNQTGTDVMAYEILQDGTVTFTQEITAADFALASDPRLKIVESPVTNGLEIIEALNPVNYTWKDKRDDYSHIGFLTTDVEKVRPELVIKGQETDSLSYMRFTAINTAAIKELNDQIKELQDQLKELKNGYST